MLSNTLLKKNKYGFSLFEVVVTMAIVAIFIAAASNVFTQKFKRKVALPAHGRFECYYDNAGNLTQRYVSENVLVNDFHPTEGYCTFEPKQTAQYLVINAVGGGGAGGAMYGGSAGIYKSIFLTTTTHVLHIYPGRGATFNPANNLVDDDFGGQTYLVDANSNNHDVIRLDGGRSNSGDMLLVKDCSVSYARYTCRRDPYCRVNNEARQLIVGYCTANGDSLSDEAEDAVPFDTAFYEYRDNNREDLSNVVLSYSKRLDSDDDLLQYEALYTLALQVQGNFTGERQSSGFDTYIEALEIKDGIAATDPAPGTGGGIGEDGGNGAVVIAW